MIGRGPATRVAFIASASYSGSTLLGLLLGADPAVLYCGEVNQYRRAAWRPRPAVCTCGSDYEECALWGPVYEDLPDGLDLNPAPGFSLANLRAVVSAVARPRVRRVTTEYGRVVEALRRHALRGGVPRWILDSSKSLHAMDALARSADVELRVIHLVRDGRAVAVSFRKRGRSPMAALLAWALVHTGVYLYTRRRGIPRLGVNYRCLCEDGRAAMDGIRRFLDLDAVPGDGSPTIGAGPWHLMRCNREVRQWATGERPFEGLRYHGDTAGLPRRDRFVARLVADPLYRLLAPGGEPARQGRER